MDGAHNCLTLVPGEVVEKLADRACFKRIETRRGLIQQDHRGVRDELNTDRASLAFTSRQDFSMDVTNLAFGDVSHAELSDDLVHEFVLLIITDFELEASCECESLTDCESREENVVLHDVRSKLLEALLVHGDLVVEEDVARELGARRRCHSVGQNVQ